jgi:hypothetical protein
MRAVGGAAEIHAWIQHAMAAFSAFLLTVVLEEFNTVTAVRAVDFKDILTAPVAAVLSRALHGSILCDLYLF